MKIARSLFLMISFLALIAVVLVGSDVSIAQDEQLTKSADSSGQKLLSELNLNMKMLDGSKADFSKYDGKVIVFVNVASKCGFTPQYEQLQELQEKYAEKGLAIVGVPCNQFGNQEPGTAQEIAQFCQENYGVTFDMLAKVDVNGDEQCELYKFLTGFDLQPAGKGDVKWNFEKFVLNRSGQPIARFKRNVKPTNFKFLKTVSSALTETPAVIGAEDSGQRPPYSHVSQKSGKTYYLFKREVDLKNSDKTSTIYFFAKDPDNEKGTPVAAVPNDRVVSETKTGMLVLKRRQ